MQAIAIKTEKIALNTPLATILSFLPPLEEENVICISAKILSLSQGRIITKVNKEMLIRKEADAYFEDEKSPYKLTIKEGVLLPNAGIDASNCPTQGGLIVYPRHIQALAKKIYTSLRKKNNVQALGVVIVDSHTTPLRRGTLGVGIGFYGFLPVFSYIGEEDLYGRPLSVSQKNVLDALACMGVFVMGEGAEQTPMALIRNAPSLVFSPSGKREDIEIPLNEDIYKPLFHQQKWIIKKN